MTEPFDDEPSVSKQTIREVMDAVRRAQMEEARLQQLEELRRRREQKQRRLQERRERDVQRLRETKARRQKSMQEANERAGRHVMEANRALRAALRDMGEAAIEKFSPEAREQARSRRSIETALAALRQFGRNTFYESEVDPDLD